MCFYCSAGNMEIRKLVFLILNLAITLVFFALLIVGGLLMGFTNYAATVMATGSYDAKHVGNYDTFGIDDIEMDDEQEYERAGYRLAILAVFVLGVAVLGWIVVGSDKKRPKLAYRGCLVYVVCLAVLTAVQLGVYSDFMDWFAKIPSRMKEYYERHPISTNYTNRTTGTGHWTEYSITVNVINFVYECCGIFGMQDFGSSISSVPASCCKRDYVIGGYTGACGNTAELYFYNQHGCLLKVKFKVMKNLTIVAVLTTVILLLQISQVVLGFLIIKQNQGAKVTPDLNKDHVTDPTNAPDLTKDHVTNPANLANGAPLAEQPGPSRDTQNKNQAAGKDENEPSKKSPRKGKKNVPSMKKKETPSQQLVEQPGTPRETPRESHVTEKESHVAEKDGPAMLPDPESTDTRPDTLPTRSPDPSDPVRPGAKSPDATRQDLQTHKDSHHDTEHDSGFGNI